MYVVNHLILLGHSCGPSVSSLPRDQIDLGWNSASQMAHVSIMNLFRFRAKKVGENSVSSKKLCLIEKRKQSGMHWRS